MSSKGIWSEIVENDVAGIIVATFGVSSKLAHELYYECGEDLEAIRKNLIKRSNRLEHTCRCKLCGRTLKDPKSIKRGYGEECYKKSQAKLYNNIFES